MLNGLPLSSEKPPPLRWWEYVTTIQLQCESWTEIAEFDFFTKEQKDVFYEQIPEEIWNAEPENESLFSSPEDMPLEDGYVPFMYPYEYVKEILKEDDVSDLWTIVE